MKFDTNISRWRNLILISPVEKIRYWFLQLGKFDTYFSKWKNSLQISLYGKTRYQYFFSWVEKFNTDVSEWGNINFSKWRNWKPIHLGGENRNTNKWKLFPTAWIMIYLDTRFSELVTGLYSFEYILISYNIFWKIYVNIQMLSRFATFLPSFQ